MTPDDEIPEHDPLAESARRALHRIAATDPVDVAPWSAINARGRRQRQLRVATAIAACVVVLAGVTAALTSATRKSDHVSVAAPNATTTTSTTAPASTSSSVPTTTVPTSPTVGCVGTCATVPLPPAPSTVPSQIALPAQPGDFTGTLQHWGDACVDNCDISNFEKLNLLTIRNTTDHPIDLSTSASVRVAVVCATNMTAEGLLTTRLHAPPVDFVKAGYDANGQYNGISYDTPGSSLAPGAEAKSTGVLGFSSYATDPLEPGPATCEGAIVSTSDGSWKSETLTVVARLTNVPIYSFKLVSPTGTATTTTFDAATTTSAPATATTTTAP
jgi:hypothetical protein